MYNDEIMMLYLVFAMVLMIEDRPIVASGLLTLALSVKGGVLLALPAFLGVVHHNYGVRTLLKSCLIIVSF